MTATPDSFAAVVAELRANYDGKDELVILEASDFGDFADRIERLDAEMRKGITREDNDVVMPFALYREMTDADTKLTKDNAELCARLAACEKDAERYRWCRENMGYDRGYFGVDGPPFQGCGDREDFDAAIDADIASSPSPGVMGGKGEK